MTNARAAKDARQKAAELRAEAAKAQARQRTITITVVAAVIIAVVVAAVVLIRVASQDQQAREAAASAPPQNLTEGGMLYGNTTAPVTLEIYEDFMCPVCGQLEEANGEQINAWVADNKVKVIYRPVAILDRFSQGTEYSTRSVNAAAAVMDTSPEAFKAFHDALFVNQPAENTEGLPDSQLIEMAVAAGADEAALTPLINERRFDGWAAEVTDKFSQDGFTGTPTVVMDGEQIDNSNLEPAKFKSLVEAKFPADQ